MIFLVIVLILAGICYCYGVFGKNKPFYTVVVDCGSTGTRLNVYEWKFDNKKNLGLPNLLHSFPHESAKNPSWKNGCEYHNMQTEPGLDRFVGNYSGVRASLVSDTPIFVLATAGLRRLAVEEGTRVLDDVERVVKEYEFMWRRDWIRVLIGREEACYGWVALNYKMGRLNKLSNESPTLWLLDLGGSSLQIVMETNEAREDSHILASKIGLVK
ncbi:putative apyrase 7 [Bienertia sinuspersici]